MVKRTATTMAKRTKYSQAELMHYDTVIGTSGNFALMTVKPQQGDAGNQFVGSALNLKSIDVSVYCGTAGTPGDAIRVTLLIPRDPSVVPTHLDPYRKYSERDYIILHDELIPRVASNGCRFKRNLTGKMKFNSTGTVTLENNLMVAINLEAAASGNMFGGVRLYYTDP